MEIKEMLLQVQRGTITVEEAEAELKDLPFKDLGYAKLDYHRKLRSGFPETVFCQGKPDEYLGRIFKELYERNGEVMGTRASAEQYQLVKELLPEAVYDPISHIIKAQREAKKLEGCVAVLTGGTADVPVAEEAAQTAEFFGCYVERIYDVGVAGLHRTLAHLDDIMNASVIITIAGMEGALASVIGGLADCPVIAVPTSVGYGASFNGLTALLSMLNSCASGVSVVNIDNGFGAGYLAGMINHIA